MALFSFQQFSVKSREMASRLFQTHFKETTKAIALQWLLSIPGKIRTCNLRLRSAMTHCGLISDSLQIPIIVEIRQTANLPLGAARTANVGTVLKSVPIFHYAQTFVVGVTLSVTQDRNVTSPIASPITV